MSNRANQSPIEDIDLMLRADGECSESENERVDDFADSDADAGAKLESLYQVGDMVRGQLELAADDAPFDSGELWKNIERRIAANGHAPAAADELRETHKEAAPGFFQRLAEWFENYRGHLVTGALSAAAACFIVLAVSGDKAPADGDGTVATPSRLGSEATQPKRLGTEPPPQAQLTSRPVEVESLEVYEGSGTVITVGGDGEDSTAVIWLSPAETEETVEGPI